MERMPKKEEKKREDMAKTIKFFFVRKENNA